MRTTSSSTTRRALVATVLVAALTGAAGLAATSASGTTQEPAAAPSLTFSNPGKIDNPYLPLTARRRCEMRGEDEEGTRTRSVRTVLQRTKAFEIGGARVNAAVIRDDAYEGGELVERTLDYFAQADDGTVYYLGEQVQNRRNGRVVNTRGTWLYGRDTDRPGVAMPANPQLGQQWHFEDVPGITTESNRVEEVGLRTRVAGRVLTDVIRVQEFIQPEGDIEYKLYARGIGLVREYASDERSSFVGCR